MSKLLLYCTKNKWRLFFDKVKQIFTLGKVKSNNDLNGKIIAECDFEVEEIEFEYVFHSGYSDVSYKTKTLNDNEIFRQSCLRPIDMNTYFRRNFIMKEKGNCGYAIHLKNLHIFDNPRELYDCLIHPKIESKYYGCEHLSKAPQNMMYVELDDIKYILISIQPQWMCLILNRIKDVEVRKVVLKEMIK